MSASVNYRPKTTGPMLPAYLDASHPEARRGTTHLRTLDTNLVVGLDTRRGVFQVWGPSLEAGGWVPLCDCQDDTGQPFRGVVPWEIICAALRKAREGELSVDVAAQANEKLRRDLEADRDREIEEGAKYYAKAAARSLTDEKYSIEDVERGFNARWI